MHTPGVDVSPWQQRAVILPRALWADSCMWQWTPGYGVGHCGHILRLAEDEIVAHVWDMQWEHYWIIFGSGMGIPLDVMYEGLGPHDRRTLRGSCREAWLRGMGLTPETIMGSDCRYSDHQREPSREDEDQRSTWKTIEPRKRSPSQRSNAQSKKEEAPVKVKASSQRRKGPRKK